MLLILSWFDFHHQLRIGWQLKKLSFDQYARYTGDYCAA